MESIIDQLVNNFDFSLMFVINVISYVIIKFIDEVNGDKPVPLWAKRAVSGGMSVAFGVLYVLIGGCSTIVAINSAILAPVSWSWIFRPVLMKMGFGYKQKEEK